MINYMKRKSKKEKKIANEYFDPTLKFFIYAFLSLYLDKGQL